MRNTWIFWLCVALTLVGIVVFFGISVVHGVAGGEEFGKSCECPKGYQSIPSRLEGELVGCALFTSQTNPEAKLVSFTYSITEPVCS